MNGDAELVPDFLQGTLGIRGCCHNHHAEEVEKFFGAPTAPRWADIPAITG
jgi:hypothetical protein